MTTRHSRYAVGLGGCIPGLALLVPLISGCGDAGKQTSAHHPGSASSVGMFTPPTSSAAVEPDDLLLRQPGFFPDEDPAEYGKLVDVVKTQMPRTTQGAAVVLRFINASTGYRYSAGFISDPGFVPFKGNPGQAILLAASHEGEGLAFFFSAMKTGHFECGRDDFDIEFAPAGVRGTDPSANWAQNPGGSCEVEIYEGTNPGDLQGTLFGKVVSNDGATLFTIEQGYFYARNPYVVSPDESGKPHDKHSHDIPASSKKNSATPRPNE